MKPVVYLTSRASTMMDGKNAKHIGQIPVPLSRQGVRESAKLSHRFIGTKVKRIITSSTPAAMQTGSAIQNATSAPSQASNDLKPWDVGHFAGKSEKASKEELNAYKNSPDTVVPGGESYNAFKKRWKAGLSNILTEAQERSPLAVVTHNSNINQVSEWVMHRPLGKSKNPTPVYELSHDGNQWSLGEV